MGLLRESLCEVWRDVPGYEGLYQVSSAGRVKRLAHATVRSDGVRRQWPERMMSPWMARGYPSVQLWRVEDGHRRGKKVQVHRLVCMAWHGLPPPGEPYACHNDGDPQNMHPSNLRWDSQKGNMRDSVRHGTSNRGARHGLSKLSEEQVLAIRAEYAGGGVLQRELADRYGISQQQVGRLVRGESWSWLKH